MRLGFIGIGSMAKCHAAAACELGAEIPVASASSLYSDSWDTWPYPSKRCVTVKEVADQCDKLVVAGPWQSQPHLSRFALCQRPALLEKPVGLQPGDVPRGTAMVCYNRRFYRPVQRLWLRGRQDLLSVHVTISEWVHHYIATVGRDVIPWLLEYTSCHIFDLLLYILGPITVDRMRRYLTGMNGVLLAGDIPIYLSVNHDDPSPVGMVFRYPGETWVLSPLEELNIYKGVDITDTVPRTLMPRIIETIPAKCSDHKPGILEQMQAFIEDDWSIAADLHQAADVIDLIAEVKGESSDVGQRPMHP